MRLGLDEGWKGSTSVSTGWDDGYMQRSTQHGSDARGSRICAWDEALSQPTSQETLTRDVSMLASAAQIVGYLS